MAVTQRQQQRRTVTTNGRTTWKRKEADGTLRRVSLQFQTAGELLAEIIPPRRFLPGAMVA